MKKVIATDLVRALRKLPHGETLLALCPFDHVVRVAGSIAFERRIDFEALDMSHPKRGDFVQVTARAPTVKPADSSPVARPNVTRLGTK